MKKLLSLVLCFCLLFAVPVSAASKTVTVTKMCNSPSEAGKLKKVTTGTTKIKVKKGKGTSGIRFVAPKDGTYTFTFSNFKCDTKKDVGTVFCFWLAEKNNPDFVVIDQDIDNAMPHITNFEKASASAKTVVKLKKDQVLCIVCDGSAPYIEGYGLPMGGEYLYKAYTFKLKIKAN